MLKKPTVLAAGLFTAAWAFVAFLPPFQEWLYGDLKFYITWGNDISNHLVPYRDFTLEYPPGAIPAFVAPVYLHKIFNYASTYYFWFRIEILIIGLLTVWSTAKALEHLDATRRRTYAALTLSALMPALLGPIALSRYDYWPTLLAIAGLAALLADRPVLACVLLAAGAAAKVFPIVLVPFALFELWRRERTRGLVKGLAAMVAVLALAFGPFLVLAPHGLTYSLHRQNSRPLQVESTAAAGFLIAHEVAGTHLQIEKSAGSDNFVGGGPRAATTVTEVLTALALVGVYLLYLRGRRDKETLVVAAVAAVTAYIAFSKVFSPQYLVWLFPLVPLVAGRRGLRASILLTVAVAMTQVYEPFRYADYVHTLAPWLSWLVISRDAVFVALLGLLLWTLYCASATGRPEPPRAFDADQNGGGGASGLRRRE